MKEVLEGLYLSWPLWAFLGVLGVALVIEEGIVAYNRKKLVDNPTLW